MNVPEAFYTIDILFVAFVLLFAVVGLFRRISGELASLLSLVMLLCGICFFYPSLTQFASRKWGVLSASIVQGVVIVALVLAAIILSFLMNRLFRQIFRSRVGEVTNRLIGGAIALLRGALIGVSLFAALSLMPNETLYTSLSEKSVIGAWVCSRFTPWLYPRLMELPVFDQKEN
jgi:uncharacterized membrane protein required for colicin V production